MYTEEEAKIVFESYKRMIRYHGDPQNISFVSCYYFTNYQRLIIEFSYPSIWDNKHLKYDVIELNHTEIAQIKNQMELDKEEAKEKVKETLFDE